MEYSLVQPALQDPAYPHSAFTFLSNCKTKPLYSEALLERFFNRLVSSEKNVVEVWQNREKVACAILIDEITNPHNSANIEYLGFQHLQDPRAVLSLIFDQFEELTKQRGKHSGLIVSHNSSLPFTKDLLVELGFAPFYETFDLEKTEFSQIGAIVLNKQFSLQELQESEFSEFYSVLCRSFADNPETAIGSLADMRVGFAKKSLPTFIVKQRSTNKIAGFINLDFNQSSKIAEVNTLGVLPEFRNLGLGNYLLALGTKHLETLSPSSISLSVAAKNKAALNLYFENGFKVTQEFSSFRKQV